MHRKVEKVLKKIIDNRCTGTHIYTIRDSLQKNSGYCLDKKTLTHKTSKCTVGDIFLSYAFRPLSSAAVPRKQRANLEPR